MLRKTVGSIVALVLACTVLTVIGVEPAHADNGEINTIVGGGNRRGYLRTEALAVDSTGTVYISTSIDNTVLVLDSATGALSRYAGTGQAGFSGDGGPASAAQLDQVLGLAFDADDNLYIADSSNRRIRRVDAVTKIITTVAGNGTQVFESSSAAGDGGPALNASFGWPIDVAIMPSGDLVVVDDVQRRLRRISADTGLISALVGGGEVVPTIDTPAVDAQFVSPISVVFDSAGIGFIADISHGAVYRIDPATGLISLYAGDGDFGAPNPGDGDPALDALISPWHLAVDGADNLYISDSDSRSVRRIDAATGIISSYAGTAQRRPHFDDEFDVSLNGDGGPALDARVHPTGGLAVDDDGNVYYGDPVYDSVRRVDVATQIISTVAGAGAANEKGDLGHALDASLDTPAGLVYDSGGNLYIADAENHRVRRVDALTGIITTVAGTGAAGFSGDGGLAALAELNRPWGLAVDAADNLYVSDLENQRVRRIDAATGLIQTIAGTGTEGFNGDGGPAVAAEFDDPRGLAVDDAGNVYVADYWNGRVRKIDAATSVISTFAGTGDYDRGGGRLLPIVNDVPATESNVNRPAALVFDGTSRLLIGQSNAVRQVDLATGLISDVPISLPGSEVPHAEDHIGGWVAGMALDAAGNLYISDFDRIRRLDAMTGVLEPFAGLGFTGGGFGLGDGGHASEALIDSPVGILVASDNNVVFADSGNNRVRRIETALVCGGQPVTIDMNDGFSGIGTPGPDVILGTPGPDIIDAGEGDDIVCAGYGDDEVFGGPGADRLAGQSGSDKLFGGQGFDVITGGNDDDTIHGNRGDDELHGGEGRDRIFGYAGNDTIYGDDGDDRLHGNFGNDVIYGGRGADRIFGYGDDDVLYGDNGDGVGRWPSDNDVIGGNFGNDMIYGEGGNDRVYGSDGQDIVDGGNGQDLVEGNSGDDIVRGGDGSDRLDGGINVDECDGGAGRGTDEATRCETLINIP